MLNPLPRPAIAYGKTQHIPALDGLRGIAILSVMFFHCFPLQFTKPGWSGVDLFFVLSGFLITGILLDSKTAPHYYRNFIIRRILRIFPLYYCVLAIIFLILPSLLPGFFGNDFNYYIHHQQWFWLYSQNWLFSIDGFPGNLIIIHFWSLAVEEQFYIIWPWIVKIFTGKILLFVCIALCIVSILFRLKIGNLWFHYDTYRYMATLARMDALVIGAMIAIIIRNSPALLEKITLPLLLISIIAIVAGIIVFRSLNFLALPSVYTFIDIAYGCVLIYSLSPEKLFMINRIVNNRILIWFGKYSYGLYVYHFMIYVLLEKKVQPYLSDITGNSFVAMIITGGLTFGAAIGISVLSFHYLERPFLLLKRYFNYKSRLSR